MSRADEEREPEAATYPAYPARASPRRPTWWSKAWLRAIEESSYGEADLKRGRALARAGAVGAIAVRVGGFHAAVTEGEHPFTASGEVAPLTPEDADVLVDVLAEEAGRIAALRSGHLPHPLVEAIEEAGVELLPYGGELGWSCTCQHWVEPCRHALGLGTQVGWLLNEDPLLLLHLRGLPREQLLARLVAATAHPIAQPTAHPSGEPSDEPSAEPHHLLDDAAEDAAIRAEELLRDLSGEAG